MARAYFNDLAKWLQDSTHADETFVAMYGGEQTAFCRFNNAKVRQLGDVSQSWLDLRLISNKRQLNTEVSLTGDLALDEMRLGHSLANMREHLQVLPEDPHILLNEEVTNTDLVKRNQLPETAMIVEDIAELSEGKDIVGILASGQIQRGFANSYGQFNWFETSSYNFDWSLYLRADKAVKSGVAGPVWRRQDYAEAVAKAAETANILAKEPKTIAPGKYRVYLAPAAVAEIAGVLAWGGFGAKSVKTKQSPLNKLYLGEAKLDERITLRENTGVGMSPNFDEAGFVRPDVANLIEGGRASGMLTNARSAQEYGIAANGANGMEAPESQEMLGGALLEKDILQAIGTGLYIQNLWYLNYSDRNQCRITGMTRFATLWVEDGQIVSPVNVMRFDESLYEMLGPKLIDLTKERSVIANAMTYDYRATGGQILPGLLIDDFTFTL